MKIQMLFLAALLFTGTGIARANTINDRGIAPCSYGGLTLSGNCHFFEIYATQQFGNSPFYPSNPACGDTATYLTWTGKLSQTYYSKTQINVALQSGTATINFGTDQYQCNPFAVPQIGWQYEGQQSMTVTY